MSVAIKTKGFGVPNTIDPHHFVVTVPSGKKGEIIIAEHFGLFALDKLPDILIRCTLPRSAWRSISDEVKKVFNGRLREKKLKSSQWVQGENFVERLLGKELCVLAWAIERAPKEAYPIALANWMAFKPEERWWLFKMVHQTSCNLAGYTEDYEENKDIGWRKALQIALTESSKGHEILQKKRPLKKQKKNPSKRDSFSAPLFEVSE